MSTAYDQDRIRFAGSGSVVDTTNVPFGYYLNEPGVNTASIGSFEVDCRNGATFAARMLGYPIVDIEMMDVNFYACFEDAVSNYGSIVNQFNIRNNLLNLQGLPTDTYSDVSGMNVTGAGLPTIIQLSKQYGSEIEIGGYVDVKKGTIPVSASVQTYDLQAIIGDGVESGSRIEVRRVFQQNAPATARIFDPSLGVTGLGYNNLLNEMGMGAYGVGTQFLMTPIFEDLLRIQQIEFNDLIRKSTYSFQITNNKLKIFPIPTFGYNLYIEYVVEKDKNITNFTSGSNYQYVSDFSNAPYQNIRYSKINSVGKQWIKKYFLASCKETLGRILSKYQSIPGTGESFTMDGAELRSEATAEKEILMTQLQENLETTIKSNQLEMKSKESEEMQKVLKNVPLCIYIGLFFFMLLVSNYDGINMSIM